MADRLCSRCHAPGHNRQTCPQPRAPGTPRGRARPAPRPERSAPNRCETCPAMVATFRRRGCKRRFCEVCVRARMVEAKRAKADAERARRGMPPRVASRVCAGCPAMMVDPRPNKVFCSQFCCNRASIRRRREADCA